MTRNRVKGDQVAGIMAALAIALALLMPTDATAQARIYDSGRVSGRAGTGSNGTVTIYSADGRKVGSIATLQKRERR